MPSASVVNIEGVLVATAPWVVSDALWERLHAVLLSELRAAGALEWSRAVADSSHVQAKKGAPRRGRARLIEPDPAPSITFS